VVASDGGWSVYAAPRAGGGYDVTVSSGELTTGSVSGAAGPALEATYVQTSSGDAIVGRARAKGAARVRIGLPDGTARAAAVGPHGFFVVALAPGDRPGEGALTLRAVGGGGATLATTRIAADG
jgi:hypothetical protein